LLLEHINGIGELIKQLIEVVLGFFDEMFKDLLDEIVTYSVRLFLSLEQSRMMNCSGF
jgi:hypothetical protein